MGASSSPSEEPLEEPTTTVPPDSGSDAGAKLDEAFASMLGGANAGEEKPEKKVDSKQPTARADVSDIIARLRAGTDSNPPLIEGVDPKISDKFRAAMQLGHPNMAPQSVSGFADLLVEEDPVDSTPLTDDHEKLAITLTGCLDIYNEMGIRLAVIDAAAAAFVYREKKLTDEESLALTFALLKTFTDFMREYIFGKGTGFKAHKLSHLAHREIEKVSTIDYRHNTVETEPEMMARFEKLDYLMRDLPVPEPDEALVDAFLQKFNIDWVV